MLKELRKKRSALKAEMDGILAGATDDTLTDEQQASWDKLKADYEKLSAQIERAEWKEAEDAKVEAEKAKIESKPEPKAGKPKVENQPAPKVVFGAVAPKLKAFDNAEAAHACGRWFAAEVFGHKQSADWIARNPLATTMEGGTDNIGGATVPDIMSSTLLKLVQEYGAFPKHARNVPMGSDVMTIPQNQGGITVSAEGEADSIDEANDTWAKVTLTAAKYACLTRMSSELAEDSIISIIDDVVDSHARAHALKIDTEGFAGTAGVETKINTSSGATYAGSIVTADATHLNPSDFTVTELMSVIGKLPQYSGQNAAWYLSKPMWANSIGRLSMAAGGNSTGDYSGGPSNVSFMGYPVVWTSVLDSTLTDEASAIKILFGDLYQAAAFGLRRNLTISRSSERYFDTDEIAIKTTMRWAVNVHSLGGASAAGPMIALKTPSS